MEKAHKRYGGQDGPGIVSRLQVPHGTHRTRVGTEERVERRSAQRSKLRNEAL